MKCVKYLLFNSLLLSCLNLQAKEAKSVQKVILAADENAKTTFRYAFIEVKDIVVPNIVSLKKKLDPLVGSNLTMEKIKKIKETVFQHYLANSVEFVLITIPEQKISEGGILVLVHESQVGKVDIEGTRWNSPLLLESYLGMQQGIPLNQKKLLDRLDFINRNPFRHVDLIYSPGDAPFTTDITLYVDERRSYRFYGGTDNTGVSSTDAERFYFGFNWGHVLGEDQILSYQYTSAYDVRKFQAHTLQYTVLLPIRHFMNFFGGYASVHPSMSFGSITSKQHGETIQASGRYGIPLPGGRFYSHQVVFGFDFKRTNNTFDFVEVFPRVGNHVNLTQFVGEYQWNWRSAKRNITFTQEIFCSPGPMLGDQSDSDFESLRPGAKNQWVYGKTSFSYLQYLPGDYSFWFLCIGQVSDQNLLPSEQVGIGGYNTVRGYAERQLNQDIALLATVEWRTPVLRIMKRAWKHPIRDGFQFLSFVDYGIGTNHTPLPGEPRAQYLWGIGPGIRYTIDPFLAIRLDWGIKLHRKDYFEGGFSRIHFACTASY